MNTSPKTVLIALGIILALGAIWILWKGFGRTEVANLDSQGTSIVAFGDSLIYGYGSTPGKDFVTLVSNEIGYPIVNMGVNGDTTETGLARVNDVLIQDPRIVIILLGGNDFLRQKPGDAVFANLGSIIDAIQAKGAAVLLLGIRGGLLNDGYAGRFKELAASHHAAFVPNVLDGLFGHREYMYDQIHPNDAGYAKIANKVAPVLKDMLKKK